MSIVADITRSYAQPRAVIQARLTEGQREDRALMFLAIACLLIFVAQWPRLRREAFLDESVPFDALIGGLVMGWLFIAPLALYGLAALSRVIAGLFGGQGSWYTARLALFWSLLAATPLWLLNGLVAGFIGSGPQLGITGAIALAVFLIFWGLSLIEAESGQVVT